MAKRMTFCKIPECHYQGGICCHDCDKYQPCKKKCLNDQKNCHNTSENNVVPRKTTSANTKWEEKDLEFLKKNYTTMEMEKIAQKLDRSVDAVRKRANKMGLTRR